MNKELLEILKNFDSIIIEDYYPFEKEKILRDAIKIFDDTNKKENAKLLRTEWMLLNHTFGYSSEITDKLEWIYQNINKKPPFWNFENETTEYFEKRLQSSLPNLTAARINYYLWFAKNDVKFARDSIHLFIKSGVEHAKSFGDNSAACFNIAYKFSKSMNFSDIIQNELIPSLIKSLHTAKDGELYLYKHLVELFLSIIPELWQKIKDEERDFCNDLIKECDKISRNFALEGVFHSSNVWLEMVKKFHQEMKNQKDADVATRTQLDNIIKSAEQNPSPLVKVSFYQDAIAYMAKNNIHDDSLKKKLIIELEKNNKESVPLFKKIETVVDIKNDNIKAALNEILKSEDNPENIIKILSKFLIPSYFMIEKEVKEKQHENIALALPLVRQSGSHISKSYCGDERINYEISTHLVLSLQVNSVVIREAIKLKKVNKKDIGDIIEKSKINVSQREILKRGVERFFSADYISSLHILVFQIEQLIRDVMSRRGHTNFVFNQKDGSHRQRLLDSLIRDPDVNSVFGKDFVTTIQAFVSEIDHQNIRNEVGHGVINVEKLNEVNSSVILFLNLYLLSNFLL